MGCECNNRRIENANPEGTFHKNKESNKTGIKRNPSLSTNNSEDESNLDNNVEDHRNLADDTEEDDDNIDEQIARNLVTSLLENDFFFRDLIPTINSLSSKDFKKLFHGDCDYNYKTKNKAQIRRLAHKFDNFNYILKFIYKENKYEEYFKELWEKYPYIEDLKHLEEDKISSKLNSTLPNFKYWPENIKKDLIILIKSTELSSSKEYIRKIKDEYVEVDKTLKKLINIKNTFKKEDDDEYYKKNDNVFRKDIDKFIQYFNKNSKDKNKQLTEKDIQKIQKEHNQQKNEYVDNSPYLQENVEAIIDVVIFGVMKKLGIKNIKEEAPGLILNYQNENYDYDFFDDWDEDSYDEDYEEEGNDNDEEKEMAEWFSVAKNFALLIYRGYQTYQTIKLSEKLIGERRSELEKISSDFQEYQNSKRFSKNNPSENLKIINESIKKVEEIRKRLLEFIEKLKKEIDSNINKKKGIFGNIFYQAIKIGSSIFNLVVTKNPTHIINILNIGIGVANIVCSGIEISYINDIIDGLIEILKDANKKRKEFEKEINSLHDQTSNIKKGYPKYYH
jgi:hypothetical protein